MKKTHQAHRSAFKNGRRNVIAIITALIALACLALLTQCGPAGGKRVQLDLYVESRNPYGMKAEAVILPLAARFGGKVDLNVNYIALEDGSGRAVSVRGEEETAGDKAQLCATVHESGKAAAFILGMNQESSAGGWPAVAEKLGMDVPALSKCVEGPEGEALLRESMLKSRAAGADACPTVFIDGKRYGGELEETELLQTVCYAFRDSWPEACSRFPQPAWVNAILLQDSRCGIECDMNQVLASLRRDFPGLGLRTVDYGSDEGKKLFKEAGLAALPAVLFDATVTKGEGYGKIRGQLKPAGDTLAFTAGAVFDPLGEICDNGVDDDGNGKTDCEDPACAYSVKCRGAKPALLELFVMGDDLYSKQAVLLLKRIAAGFGSSLSIDIRYLVTKMPDGSFWSLHGPGEVEEDTVQLLVKKQAPAKWLDFAACRTQVNMTGTDWRACGRALGVDVARIEAALKRGEGGGLLARDAALARELRLKGVPAWFLNNRYLFYGLDMEAILDSLCGRNPDLESCKARAGSGKRLSGAGRAPEFTLMDLGGRPVSLSDSAGKKTVVVFWSGQCEPCKAELPELEGLHRDNPGLAILAVNMGETGDQVKSLAAGGGYTFPMLLDTDKSVSDKYNVVYTPTLWFLNGDGTVSFKHEGSMNRAELESETRRLKEGGGTP
jgi:thiol-disulfide isomerase/thioredoxin